MNDRMAKVSAALVINFSQSRLATKGTSLEPAFEGSVGSTAIAWGAEDMVSLCKEIARLASDKANAPFEPRGCPMQAWSVGTLLEALRSPQARSVDA